MNEDYTLTTFAEPITALADDPQLPPDEMKRRLQAPADELLEAHNALARTVKGITDATYPDTVTRAMLTQDVRDELDGKAAQAALTAEQTARESADDALDTRLETAENALSTKCEVYFGTYNPSSGQQTDQINLGFQPKGLIMFPQQITRDWSWLWMIWPGAQSDSTGPYQRIRFNANGFVVDWWSDRSSTGMVPYRYLAFK